VTLVGFVRGRSMNIYTHAHRVRVDGAGIDTSDPAAEGASHAR